MPPPRLHPKDGHPRHPWLEASHLIHPVDDGLDDRRRQLATACYYGLCTWVDRQVGRVIAALERTGLAETTRVVYTSDHGDNIGARGIWGKSTHYDDAVGVPMIVAGPDVARGRVCRTPVSLVDVAPTIMEAVGEDPYAWSKDLPGRSLLEIGDAPDDPARTVFSEYHAFASPSAAFMLRNGRYKYNYYVGYPARAVRSCRRSRRGAQPCADRRSTLGSLRNSRSSCATCSTPKRRTPEPRPTRPPLSRASVAPRRPATSERREPRRPRSEVVAPRRQASPMSSLRRSSKRHITSCSR